MRVACLEQILGKHNRGAAAGESCNYLRKIIKYVGWYGKGMEKARLVLTKELLLLHDKLQKNEVR